MLCNDASNNNGEEIGDPTEVALINVGDELNVSATKVRETYPDIKIYIWSGYTIEELLDMKSPVIDKILEKSNILIDGPFQWDKKDITLKLRGSSNQRIIDLTKVKKYDIIK